MSVQTTYTARAIGIEGQLYSTEQDSKIRTMINNETVVGDGTDEMAFGHGIKFEGSTDDQGALNPAAETDVIAGLILHSTAYDPDELGTIGVKPGQTLNVLRRGTILAKCEDGCSPGDRLWVRAVGATAPEAIGQLNSADDGTDMIDCTNQGVWMTTAAAGGLAELEVDFIAFPTVT